MLNDASLILKEINDSPWKGWITEVGFGVPLQAIYLSHSGASNTIIRTHCPYDKSIQELGSVRSVSANGASIFSSNIMFEDMDKIPEAYQKLFSIAITGSHKSSDEKGDCHAWISLILLDKEEDREKEWSLHVTFDKENVNQTREFYGSILSFIALDFLYSALFGLENLECFLNKYREKQEYFSIDVINMHSNYSYFDIEDMLKLVGPGNPIFIKDYVCVRPTDVLRKNSYIYRGSFNPPTLAHDFIGKDSVYEICIKNARKGSIELEDLSHRIKMLMLMGKTVMVSYDEQLFSELNSVLKRIIPNKNYNFIVGVDTLNAITDLKWYSSFEEELKDFSKRNGNAKFLIINRVSQETKEPLSIKETMILDYINYEIVEAACFDKPISSSEVRSGNIDKCILLVQEYIKSNKLYSYGI